MRRSLAALTPIVALLVVAASSEAATLTVVGDESCYRPGHVLLLSGTGFTPNQQVTLRLDNEDLGSVTADPAGNISSPLSIGPTSFRRVGTHKVVATDTTNPAIVAEARFRGSPLRLSVRPSNGVVGQRSRIKAAGFTTGKRLYAHVTRKRFRRNIPIGKLKGPCHTLKVRRRILPAGLAAGAYRVQFDTRRRYSPRTSLFVSFRVTVSR